jgi:K+-sensing histidine kinase KdpD
MNDRASNAARIMVVDDTPENLTLLQDMLRNHGYQVFALPNGQMALKAVTKNPPDLILLDIRMPGLNGYEVCERLKADKQTADIPIIFLSALHDADDKIKAFQAGGVDYITKPFHSEEVEARVRTHLQLRESYRQLKELEDLRDNLVHMVVHDMRAPLSNIGVYLDLLATVEGTTLSPKGQQYLSAAGEANSVLIKMVGAMLDINRMEAGQLPLELTECDLAGIIPEALVRLGTLKDNRQIIVDLDRTCLPIKADSQLILRVIQNLIDNALRFTTRDGLIRIVTHEAGDHIRVLVEDDGQGIPAAYRQKIFEKFGQVEARKAGRKYSTGLGLAFCKLAVEAHGGRIGVDSEEEEGSTFWFELPRTR